MNDRVTELLLESRLSEAIHEVMNEVNAIQDWKLRTRFDEIQVSFLSLTECFKQGMLDNSRQQMHKQFICKTLLLHFDIERRAAIAAGNSLYAKTARELEETPVSVIFELLGKREGRPLSEHETEQREENINALFSWIWTSEAWSKETLREITRELDSPTLSPTCKLLVVSAAGLALLERFDPFKLFLLIHAADRFDDEIQARALTGMHLATLKSGHLFKLFPQLAEAVKRLAENPEVVEKYAIVQISLLQSMEAHIVEKKVKEEILPTLTQPGIMNPVKDNTFLSFNPEWLDEHENNPRVRDIQEKLSEMNELQLSGADVYYATFNSMKRFPFFNQPASWMRPFNTGHPAVAAYFNQDPGIGGVLENTLFNNRLFCHSDKYSLFFFLTQNLNRVDMDLIKEQFTQEQTAMLEEFAHGKLPSWSCMANGWVQDLYRFYKLFRFKEEFYNPFEKSVYALGSPELEPLFNHETTLAASAKFLLGKSRFKLAAQTYRRIEQEGFIDVIDYKFYQKMGFAYQRSSQHAQALECYKRSDIMQPHNIWTLAHTALCQSLLGRREEALDTLGQLEELEPEVTGHLLLSAQQLMELGRYAEALQKLFKADYLEPDSCEIKRRLALCALHNGRFEQAEKLYTHIQETGEASWEDTVNQAHAVWLRGHAASAGALYAKAAAEGGACGFVQKMQEAHNLLQENGIDPYDILIMTDATLMYRSQ